MASAYEVNARIEFDADGEWLEAWDAADIRRSQQLLIALARETGHSVFACEVVLGVLCRLRQDVCLRAFFCLLAGFFAKRPRWRSCVLAEDPYVVDASALESFIAAHKQDAASRYAIATRQQSPEYLLMSSFNPQSSLPAFQYFFDAPGWTWEWPSRCLLLKESLAILDLPVINILLDPPLCERATNALTRHVFEAIGAILEPAPIEKKLPISEGVRLLISSITTRFQNIHDPNLPSLHFGPILHHLYHCTLP